MDNVKMFNVHTCTCSHSLFQLNLTIEFSVRCADTAELQRIVLMGKKKRAAFHTRLFNPMNLANFAFIVFMLKHKENNSKDPSH